MDIKESKKKELLFFLCIIAFGFLYDWKWFGSRISEENLAYYTINYKAGFCPGGFMGTFIGALHRIHPLGDYMMSVYFWAKVGLFLYLFLGILFLWMVYQKGKEKGYKDVPAAILGMCVVLIPMFQLESNFGSMDMYLMIVTLLSFILLLWERFEWLVPLLAVIGVCIHPAFIYRLLPLLCYFILQKKDRFKIGVATVVGSVAVFIVSQIKASVLMEHRDYFFLFCLDGNDQKLRIINMVLFVFFMLPLISMGCSILKRKDEKVFRFLICASVVLVFFDVGLKNNPGLAAYYLLVQGSFLVLMEVILTEEGAFSFRKSMKLHAWALEGKQNYFWLIYPLLFMPFKTHSICIFLDKLIRLFTGALGV